MTATPIALHIASLGEGDIREMLLLRVENTHVCELTSGH